MKFSMSNCKKIHFKIPEFPMGTKLNGDLIYTIFTYPKNGQEQGFKITWKYRLHKDKEYLFSYVCESFFSTKDDGLEINIEHLDKLLYNLYINVEIGWEEATIGSALYRTTMPIYKNMADKLRIDVLNCISGS